MRRMSFINDHELLCGIAQGDQAAFGTFFQRFKNKVYSYSFHFTRSQLLSEEITQEIFVKVWMNRLKLTEINDLEAWLSTITKNRCFDHLKKTALEQRTKMQLGVNLCQQDENVEQYISYKDQLHHLQLALQQLSPQQRVVYALNRDDGMKNEEIAHHLNLSPNTVKNHMVTALRKIRNFMESHPAGILAIIFLTKKIF